MIANSLCCYNKKSWGIFMISIISKVFQKSNLWSGYTKTSDHTHSSPLNPTHPHYPPLLPKYTSTHPYLPPPTHKKCPPTDLPAKIYLHPPIKNVHPPLTHPKYTSPHSHSPIKDVDQWKAHQFQAFQFDYFILIWVFILFIFILSPAFLWGGSLCYTY